MIEFDSWAAWKLRELEREAARREGREEPPPFMWPALPPPYAEILPAKGAPGDEWRVIGWHMDFSRLPRLSWTREEAEALLRGGRSR